MNVMIYNIRSNIIINIETKCPYPTHPASCLLLLLLRRRPAEGGGVVSYHAFSRKLGGLVRDPGRPFYPDICRMKWPSFFVGFCGSNLIKTSKTAIWRGSRAGSRFPLAVPFERGVTFHHADRMWGSANTVNMQ